MACVELVVWRWGPPKSEEPAPTRPHPLATGGRERPLPWRPRCLQVILPRHHRCLQAIPPMSAHCLQAIPPMSAHCLGAPTGRGTGLNYFYRSTPQPTTHQLLEPALCFVGVLFDWAKAVSVEQGGAMGRQNGSAGLRGVLSVILHRRYTLLLEKFRQSLPTVR